MEEPCHFTCETCSVSVQEHWNGGYEFCAGYERLDDAGYEGARFHSPVMDAAPHAGVCDGCELGFCGRVANDVWCAMRSCDGCQRRLCVSCFAHYEAPDDARRNGDANGNALSMAPSGEAQLAYFADAAAHCLECRHAEIDAMCPPLAPLPDALSSERERGRAEGVWA